MNVYFEEVCNGSVQFRSSRFIDCSSSISDTLKYLIKEEVKKFCVEDFQTDAIILSVQDTVNNNVLVQFRFL